MKEIKIRNVQYEVPLDVYNVLCVLQGRTDLLSVKVYNAVLRVIEDRGQIVETDVEDFDFKLEK